MDFVYTTQYSVSALHSDCFGNCRPSYLLRFSQEAAEEQCRLLGTHRAAMDEKNYFWAIIRQRIEITRLPRIGQTITLKTWPMPTTRVAYPRAAEGFDEAGNSLFKIISIWIIMDKSSRSMILPGKSGVGVAGTLLGTELKTPPGLSAGDYANHTARKVSFFDLDQNCHMNNTRYIDWVFDLLPASYHKDHPLKALTVCYNNEALEDQDINLSWSEGPVLQVDGSLTATDVNAKQTRIFCAQLEF